MIIRLMGAGMILLSCGSFGYMISRNAKNEIRALQNFILALEFMECELQYRMTPLPELCMATANITKGSISKMFYSLGKELESQILPNVSICMSSVLCRSKDVPQKIIRFAEELGNRLGIFDLDGQVRVFKSIQKEAQQALKKCQDGHEIRTRSCKTIAVCAGAAIVILLI